MLPAGTRPDRAPACASCPALPLPLAWHGGQLGAQSRRFKPARLDTLPPEPPVSTLPHGSHPHHPISPDSAPPGSALIPRKEGRYLHHLRISKEMRRKPSGVGFQAFPGDGPRPRENVCVLPVKPHGRMGEAAQCWGETESPQVAQSQIYTLVLSSLQQRGQGWGPGLCADGTPGPARHCQAAGLGNQGHPQPL